MITLRRTKELVAGGVLSIALLMLSVSGASANSDCIGLKLVEQNTVNGSSELMYIDSNETMTLTALVIEPGLKNDPIDVSDWPEGYVIITMAITDPDGNGFIPQADFLTAGTDWPDDWSPNGSMLLNQVTAVGPNDDPDSIILLDQLPVLKAVYDSIFEPYTVDASPLNAIGGGSGSMMLKTANLYPTSPGFGKKAQFDNAII